MAKQSKPDKKAPRPASRAAPDGRAADKPKAKAAAGGGNFWRRAAWSTVKWGLVAAIWGGVIAGGVVAWYAHDLPDIANLETPSRRPSVTLLARDGSAIANYGDLYGDAVRFDDLPPYLVQAVVATEDRRFFDHGGFDAWAIARAMVANVAAGSIRQGGSTLTQQLAKNIFLTPDRTLRRKIQELMLSFWLEANFTKQQIFAIYMNRVYLGAGTYGIDAASRRYFGQPAGKVNLHEAAILAGLLKAPSRYAPSRSREAALQRAAVVLDNMVAAGLLSERDAKAAERQAPRFTGAAGPGAGRYFADWILETATGYVGRAGRDIIIRTTLDPRLQARAERDLGDTIEKSGKRLGFAQGALVAMAPDGAVRAMVGGDSYDDSQFNRVTQAQRQPGSSFKLFVYVAGLEAGMRPDDRVVDGPISVAGWRPKNYDNKFHGTMTLAEAFAQSVNTVAVQVSEKAGRGRVIDAARRLGLTSKIDSNPSIALGVDEATLLEMTAAYATFANAGFASWPHGIDEIRDRDGKILFRRTESPGAAVVDGATVRAMNALMEGVIDHGTGKAARIGRPAAGKTGTSQDFRDAWFVGFTADLVTGVWVGNDDGHAMKGVTGGNAPARIWRDFMKAAHQGLPPRPLPAGSARAAPPGGRAGGSERLVFDNGPEVRD